VSEVPVRIQLSYQRAGRREDQGALWRRFPATHATEWDQRRLGDHRFVATSPGIRAVSVTAHFDGRSVHIDWSTLFGARRDAASGALLATHESTVLDEIVAAMARPSNRPRFTCDLRFVYGAFFLSFLEHAIDDRGPRYFTFGSPEHPDQILQTVTRQGTDSHARLSFALRTANATGIPCTVQLGGWGGQAGYDAQVTLDFDPRASGHQQLVRQLIAADWTALAQSPGQTPPVPDAVLDAYYDNIFVYLANHIPLARGTTMVRALSDAVRGLASNPAALVSALRDRADALVITGNHWAQRREDARTEQYQYEMSQVFGTLLASESRASPVGFARHIERVCTLDPGQVAGLTLQLGVGHCGEHANLVFTVLGWLIEHRHLAARSVMWVGWANVDHDWVLLDVQAHQVLDTEITSRRSGLYRAASQDRRVEISLFDLPAEMAAARRANPAWNPQVIDAYLDRREAPATLDAVVAGMRRRGSPRYLRMVAQYPDPGATVRDLRGQANRAAREREHPGI